MWNGPLKTDTRLRIRVLLLASEPVVRRKITAGWYAQHLDRVVHLMHHNKVVAANNVSVVKKIAVAFFKNFSSLPYCQLMARNWRS